MGDDEVHQPSSLHEPRTTAGRFFVIAMAVVFVAIAMWLLTTSIIRRSYAARIPPLPDLSAESAPVAEQLRTVHAQALANPTSGQAVGSLAMTLHASTFSREALPCYELAAALQPDERRWTWGQILLHEEFGETQRAFELLQQDVLDYLHHSQDFHLAWFKLGEAHFARGDLDAAHVAFTRATMTGRPHVESERVVPLWAYGEHGLARIAFQQGRFEDVAETLQALVSKVRRFGPGHRLLGRAYQQLGRNEDAQRALALAEQCAPYTPPDDPMLDDLARLSRSSTFLLRAASLARTKGDAARAEGRLRQALRFHPDDHDVIGELALLLASEGKLEEALSLVEQYLSLKPPHQATAIKIGGEFSRRGVHGPAIRCFRYAVELQPRNASALRNLGAALAADKQFAEAEQAFRSSLEIDPHSYITEYNLARVLFESGQHEEVAEHCRAALRINPDFVPARELLVAVEE